MGVYGSYSDSARTRRMALVVAASWDRRDVVCVPEVDADTGGGYFSSSKMLVAAVRCGLMQRVSIPKPYRGRVYRATYAATDEGGRWLEGYRKWLSEPRPEPLSDLPVPSGRRGPPMPRPQKVTVAESVQRRIADLDERVRSAREAMRERLRARRRDGRRIDRGSRPCCS